MAPLSHFAQAQARKETYRTKYLKLGLDYGTTFSAGAFYLSSASTGDFRHGVVESFGDYPGARQSSKEDVTEIPSDVRYSDEGGTKSTLIGYDALRSYAPGRSITRAKLLLEDRQITQTVRHDLADSLRELNIEAPDQVIADYLTELFLLFVKSLVDMGYDTRDEIELNCAVPNIWTQFALGRMNDAIDAASVRSGLHFSRKFFWPESEAAAEYILTKDLDTRVKSDDCFIVCDAGGGTVDLTTYKVLGHDPLCLEEVVEAAGVLCGSSYLDETFGDMVETRLRSCRFPNGPLPERHFRRQLRDVMLWFLQVLKPMFDGKLGQLGSHTFSGVQENKALGVSDGQIFICGTDLLPIFEEATKQIWGELKNQIHRARDNNHHVEKVFLVGGFSRSKFLRRSLKESLREESARLGTEKPIELVPLKTDDCAIAHGTILCSLKFDDENDSRRISHSSIGVLFHLKFDPKNPDHTRSEMQRTWDEEEQTEYLKEVIHWVLKKGDVMNVYADPIALTWPVEEHTEEDVEIRVPLYVADKRCENGYQKAYHEKSCHVYNWYTPCFKVPISDVRKLPLRPLVSRRRPRKQKPATQAKPRQSNRIKAMNGQKGASKSMSCVEVFEVADGSDTTPIATLSSVTALSADDTAESVQQADTSVTQNGEDERKKYYVINYSIRLEFEGLVAKFKLEIPKLLPVPIGETLTVPNGRNIGV